MDLSVGANDENVSDIDLFIDFHGWHADMVGATSLGTADQREHPLESIDGAICRTAEPESRPSCRAVSMVSDWHVQLQQFHLDSVSSRRR